MLDEEDKADREALSYALIQLKGRLEDEKRTGSMDYTMAGELADRVGDGNILGKLDAGDVDRAHAMLARYGMKVIPLAEVRANLARQKPDRTLLAGRLADLHRHLKGQHQHVADWRQAFELEDRIGSGWSSSDDVARAQVLLARHGR